jgi:hypothetical protein
MKEISKRSRIGTKSNLRAEAGTQGEALEQQIGVFDHKECLTPTGVKEEFQRAIKSDESEGNN